VVLKWGLVIFVSFKNKNITDLDTQVNHFALQKFNSPVVMLFFGYTHCSSVCPTKLKKLSLIQNKADPDAKWLKTIFVDLTSSPIDEATQYAKSFNPTFEAISLNKKDTEDFSRIFSVYFAKSMTSPNEIDHSDFVYVLKKVNNGYVLEKYYPNIDNSDKISNELQLLRNQ
jgi:protein SCO1/2